MNRKLIVTIIFATICIATACKQNGQAANTTNDSILSELIPPTNDSLVSVLVNDSVIQYNKYLSITRIASQQVNNGFSDSYQDALFSDTIASMLDGGLDTLSLRGQFQFSKQWLGIAFPNKDWDKVEGLQYFTTTRTAVDGYGDTITMLSPKKKGNADTDYELAFRGKKKENYAYIPTSYVKDHKLSLSLNKKIQTAIDNKKAAFQLDAKDTLLLNTVQDVRLENKHLYIVKYSTLRSDFRDGGLFGTESGLYGQILFLVEGETVYYFYSGVDVFLDFFKMQKDYYAFYRFRTTVFWGATLYKSNKNAWQQVLNAAGEF